MKNLVGIVGALLVVALNMLGHADTMRCDTGQMVSRGDTTTEVLTDCGEPTQRDRWQECQGPDEARPPTSGQRPFPRTAYVTVGR